MTSRSHGQSECRVMLYCVWLRHAKHNLVHVGVSRSTWRLILASGYPPTHYCRLHEGDPQEAICCSFIRLLRNKGHTVSPTQGWRKDLHPFIHLILWAYIFLQHFCIAAVTWHIIIEIIYTSMDKYTFILFIQNNNVIVKNVLNIKPGNNSHALQ